jgi:hypothetical protein
MIETVYSSRVMTVFHIGDRVIIKQIFATPARQGVILGVKPSEVLPEFAEYMVDIVGGEQHGRGIFYGSQLESVVSVVQNGNS